jgi:hypothetical protein
MKLWLAYLLPLTLLAQEPADKKEAKSEEKNAESPAPQAEKELNGYLDVGARWVGYGGDFNTYRSLVNLSQGMRLLGTDVSWEPTGFRLLDTLRVQGYNWGGDPYNTARVDLLKRGKYRYVGTYSNIAYYNFLPSFADPGASKAVYLNQRAFDTSVRNFDNDLTLFPGGRIIPYLSYSRNSDTGSGISTLVAEGNEYPLRNIVQWSMNELRGGIRFEMKRWHATIEQGGTNFRDDQNVYSTEKLLGNRTSPYFGQLLSLTSGQQFYHVRGNGAFTKVLLTASPTDWLDLSGSLIRSRPKTYSDFTQNLTGNLITPEDPLLFSPRGTDMFYGNVTMPHTSMSAQGEIRPVSRLRVRQSYESDRFHTTGSGVLTSSYLLTVGAQRSSEPDGERLEVTRNRHQFEALVDVSKKLVLRGGYRYEWGSAVLKASHFNTENPTERAELERYVGLAGFTAHPMSKWTITADFELADGVKTYYRTGLMDSKQYRLQNRFTLPKSFFLSVNYSRLNNSNPDQGVNFEFHSQAASGSLQWMPNGGKNITVVADYTRSAIRSDIDYLYPLGLFPLRSLYVDNAHTASLMTDLKLPMSKSYSGRLTFGGSFVTTSGSRPSSYYQPQGRLQLPVTPKLEFFSEWKYYGLSQTFYSYEGFRAHTFAGGIRFHL